MKIFSLPLSNTAKAILVICCSLVMSVILTFFDLCILMRTQEMVDNYTEVAPSKYFMEERLSSGVLSKSSLHLIWRIFLFLLIFHIQEILLHSYLLICVIKNSYRYFIVWLLANIVRVLTVTALLFFLAAYFCSLTKQKYYMITFIIMSGCLLYFFMQFKLTKYMYDMYVQLKMDAFSRMRSERANNADTFVDFNIPTIYGTTTTSLQDADQPINQEATDF